MLEVGGDRAPGDLRPLKIGNPRKLGRRAQLDDFEF
jgi:hypothetical protein